MWPPSSARRSKARRFRLALRSRGGVKLVTRENTVKLLSHRSFFPPNLVPAAKVKKTTDNPMKALRARLSKVGVKSKFLDRVVLPEWWEDSLAESEGGFREGVGYIAAHLGFNLSTLVDGTRPLAFSETKRVKYKKAKDVTDDAVCLATHYALGVARAIAGGLTDAPAAADVPDPKEWRNSLLAISDKPWICLRHIVDTTWKLGIPIIHLRNIPEGVKKPDALTTMVGNRPVVVIFNVRKSPSWIAFILAHELGHIHRKHVKPGQTLVDEKIDKQAEEKEEKEANDFASLLLTGHTDLGLHSSSWMSKQQLALAAQDFGSNYRVAPGVAALNFGFTTQNWALANGAVTILEQEDDAGACMRKALEVHLNPDDFSEEAWEWIQRATNAVE